ncbi:MAG: hypothetical protein JOY82_03595 [Streptosporangiaceae bacterium]|nr:hypothetical protein [Streptosporangiaceae bacterium]
MAVDLFEDAPGTCPEGHYLGPGLVTIGWMPCGCRSAADYSERTGGGPGHRYIVCRQCAAQGRRIFIFLPPCGDECE